MAKKTPKEQFVLELGVFTDAAITLINAWHDAEEGELADLFSKDYPFDESFDEVVVKIGRWYNTTKQQVEFENSSDPKGVKQ